MKIKKIVPALLLASVLVACGGNKEAEKKTETKTVETEKPAEEQKESTEEEKVEKTPTANVEKDFVVEEVNDDGVILSSAAEGEENDKFMVTKEKLGLDVKVGEQVRIEWDGVIMTSDPAQFGNIIKAEKILTEQ